MIDKIILIVLDSVGIGELPDAANYSDEGSDTLGNIIRVMGSLEIPKSSPYLCVISSATFL